MLRAIKLHHVLFVAFTLISSVPVLILNNWVQQSALDKEVADVQEKHLLAARNLTGDLARYATDVEGAFRLIARNLAEKNPVLGLPDLLQSLNFRYIFVVDSAGMIVSTIGPNGAAQPVAIPLASDEQNAAVLAPIFAATKRRPDQIIFSDMVQDADGETAFFLVKAIAHDQHVVGSISTQHIREAQAAVVFGERGHAAIVDRTGRAIAHPRADWVATMKDMSFLPPVQKMMRGETGVSQFYTPAMDADMVAGFTAVPKVGWGVMIPQPYEELERRARDVQNVALSIAAAGIAIAGLISWVIAVKLSAPIKSIIDATQFQRKGKTLEKVMIAFRFIPKELSILVASFNRMVAEVKEKTAFLEETSARLSEAQRIAHVGNWEWDVEQDNLWCSEEFYRICDIKPNQFGGNFEGLLALIHPGDRQKFMRKIKRAQRQGGRFTIDHRILLPGQSECYVHHEGEMQRSGQGEYNHMIGVVHDVTERQQYEKKLYHQAHFDALTNLPNRTTLIERMTDEFRTAKRENQKVGFLSIDLDNFKAVNDTCGHLVGDRLLLTAASRLSSCLSDSDCLARPGGDEFCIILPNIENQGTCADVAQKILAVMQEAFAIDGVEAFVGASIGIAQYPDDASGPAAVMRNADIALFRAKEAGRNTYCFFKDEMDREISRRVSLSNDLRRALELDELSVVYQPIVCLESGQITSAEALVRWRHPERGFVSPAEFIPIAEDTGVIGPLGLFVLRTACENAYMWSNISDGPPKVTVNLSTKQLKLGLSTETVEDVMGTTKIPAGQLTFEITESMVMSDIDEAISWMEGVRALGVQFSIDDFGTGYSSLSYLQRLPVDVLKIDRSFIQGITKSKEDLSLVETILGIGHGLNLRVVAEGAEECEQVTCLAKLGCDYVQGYYYSKPLSGEDFAKLLKDWDPAKMKPAAL